MPANGGTQERTGSRVNTCREFARYLGREKLWAVVLVVAAVFVAAAIWAPLTRTSHPLILGAKSESGSALNWYDEWADVPINVATFVVAVAIGLSNWYQQWLDSLPLVITVRFRYVRDEDSTTFSTTQLLIVDAPLDTYAGARMWAQTLGGQAPLGDKTLPLCLFAIQQPGQPLKPKQMSNDELVALVRPELEAVTE